MQCNDSHEPSASLSFRDDSPPPGHEVSHSARRHNVAKTIGIVGVHLQARRVTQVNAMNVIEVFDFKVASMPRIYK